MAIAERFPELSKYISEVPVKISDTDNTEMNIKNLSDHYASLEALLKSYVVTHLQYGNMPMN
jgi:hypothetical protein